MVECQCSTFVEERVERYVPSRLFVRQALGRSRHVSHRRNPKIQTDMQRIRSGPALGDQTSVLMFVDLPAVANFCESPALDRNRV